MTETKDVLGLDRHVVADAEVGAVASLQELLEVGILSRDLAICMLHALPQ